MNTKTLASHYAHLTGEERFRLMETADGRGDVSESDRLANAAQRLSVSMPDHAPYTQAFHELMWFTYIDLLEEAALYHEMNAKREAQIAARVAGRSNSKDAGKSQTRSRRKRVRQVTPKKENDDVKRLDWDRTAQIVYCLGFQFRAKLVGWVLFCHWLDIPPLALWDQLQLPGLDRLKIVWAMVSGGFAYRTNAEMIYFMNEIRSPDEPEITEGNLLTAVDFANMLYAWFRERTDWCR